MSKLIACGWSTDYGCDVIGYESDDSMSLLDCFAVVDTDTELGKMPIITLLRSSIFMFDKDGNRVKNDIGVDYLLNLEYISVYEKNSGIERVLDMYTKITAVETKNDYDKMMGETKQKVEKERQRELKSLDDHLDEDEDGNIQLTPDTSIL